MIFLDQNVIISFLGQGQVRIFHPVMRNNLICSSDILEVFDALGSKGEEQDVLNARFKERLFYVADATIFTLWECMMYNPDNLKTEGIVGKQCSFQEMLEQLKRFQIVLEGRNEEYPLAKKSPFDRMKGTLHQQLGTESMFRKQSLDDWWARQKFHEDMSSVKETPYKYSQEVFLQSYFQKELKGRKVLEVGCGTGYYCQQMAQWAKSVTGVDYQKRYIDMAKARCQKIPNVVFYEANVVEDFKIDAVKAGGFDFIFMIDIFLFFFSAEFQNGLVQERTSVLKRLASLLAPCGKMVIMDPSIFWLIPRLGQDNAPYGVITEYRHRQFRVIPTLEELTETFSSAGLLISRILEPGIDPAYQKIDSREYHFIRQFPQWWVFELKKEGGA